MVKWCCTCKHWERKHSKSLIGFCQFPVVLPVAYTDQEPAATHEWTRECKCWEEAEGARLTA